MLEVISKKAGEGEMGVNESTVPFEQTVVQFCNVDCDTIRI